MTPRSRPGEAGIELGGRHYPRPEHMLAVRLTHEKGQPWLVVGHNAEEVSDFAVGMLFRRAFRRSRQPATVDYLLYESPYISRSGRWRQGVDGGFAIDPDHDDDQIAARDRAWSRRAAIPGTVSRLWAASDRSDEEMRSLAQRLDAAASRMARQIPLAVDTPIDLRVEDDYESLGRYVGKTRPAAEELLAAERPRDATDVLWAPAAAGVLARLPGDDLRSKLRAAEDPRRVAAALDQIATLAAKPPASRGSKRPGLGFQAGVSLAMAPGVDTGYHADSYIDVLRHLRRIGVGAVSLMPMAGQRGPDHPRMGFLRRSASSEHDLGMVEGARRARELGFSVLYKPHVYVGGSWPGEIAMTSEADWATWWSGYRRYILHHAVLAAFAEAEIFAVGTELGKTLGREAEWRHLIESVRRIYPGYVTYAGNWWGDYDRIPFADQLDAVGVDAYFPLSHEAAATEADLQAGAQAAVSQMAAVARRLGKPLLLTEVGFSARRAAWISPHEEGSFGDQAAGTPHLVGQAAEVLVRVAVDARLYPQPLAVEAPPLAKGRDVLETAEGWEIGKLGVERDLQMMAGNGFVQGQGG